MAKKVIYTCLVGDYDQLLDPLTVDEEFDYICFSNDIGSVKRGVWEIRRIPSSLDDKVRLSRYVKLMPHVVLQEYDYSLWMDANIQITSHEFYDIINERITQGELIYQVNHCFPSCDCVYEEMKYAYSLGRCRLHETLIQYRHLELNGFPKHWGLYENNILLRRHSDAMVQKISEEWWVEFCNYTRRDQFSLVYVYWMNNYRPFLLFESGENSRNVPYLKWHNHIMKEPNIIDKVLFHAKKYIRIAMWNLSIFRV